ncbi:MAG: hypothetical protein K2W95_20330 [Candidatus Obscuribacterales bacterium]|nr:hypothetical protein [Candidatus Obscuribacterales bacterium]
MDSSEEKYSLLRSWYLAHLRKGALAEQQKLQITPGALIAADKDSVMKLAADKAMSAEENETKPTSTHGTGFLITWLVATLTGWLLLLINSGMDIPVSLNQVHALTLGILTQNSLQSSVSPLFFLLTVAFYGIPPAGIVVVNLSRRRH